MLSLNNNTNYTELPGVFVNEATVLSAKDISGMPTYNNDPETISDIAVEVEFDIGKDWIKTVIFKGNLKFKKENPKEVDHWGSAFVVKELFIMTKCFEGLNKEEMSERLEIFSKKEIPADFLSKIRGKSISILSYIRGISEEGKPRYSTWSIVDTDPDRLINAFKVSLSKGYPQNYNPELLANPKEAESFEYGLNRVEIKQNVEDDFVI